MTIFKMTIRDGVAEMIREEAIRAGLSISNYLSRLVERALEVDDPRRPISDLEEARREARDPKCHTVYDNAKDLIKSVREDVDEILKDKEV
ncbi:MAG: hypothetical protein LBF26_03090 [Puniceicoccales bacterium]|jgi:hypothetical protein|nr:hypothetical protein [Puniceicoccales bacterium]